ncbi:hypothetical protein B0H13DRAFT_2362339 [Mycena leptocephala]|nr:hypothetical protein B0H13DRAFT_2362339 [Mycena leptocephala]
MGQIVTHCDSVTSTLFATVNQALDMKQLLYVTSPSYAVEAPNTNLPDWSPDWYTLEEKKRFLTTETVGFFFLSGQEKPISWRDVVWTTSVLCFLVSRTDLFVDILSFGTFATMVTTGQDFDYIQGFDIVFGGCEYTVDAVEVGNFTGQDEHDLFMQRMDELSCKALVWPNPRHALWYREKWQLIQELDHIAATTTHTHRPETKVFETGTQFSPTTVLKREGSGCSQMRHFHDGDRRLSKRALTSILAHNHAILDARKQDPTAFGMLWLVQELVEPLRRHGEWRVFVVGGKIIGIVGTTPANDADGMHVTECRAVYGLDELDSIIAQDGVPHAVLVRAGGAKHRRDHAMAKLHEYVLLTLKVLVARTEAKFGTRSPLRDFVRVDMSFIAKPNGQPGFDYFVNEIEMQPTEVCMFSADTDMAECVADELILQLIAASESAPEDPLLELAPSPKAPRKPVFVAVAAVN